MTEAELLQKYTTPNSDTNLATITIGICTLFSSGASLWHLAALSFERFYVIVVNPFFYQFITRGVIWQLLIFWATIVLIIMFPMILVNGASIEIHPLLYAIVPISLSDGFMVGTYYIFMLHILPFGIMFVFTTITCIHSNKRVLNRKTSASDYMPGDESRRVSKLTVPEIQTVITPEEKSDDISENDDSFLALEPVNLGLSKKQRSNSVYSLTSVKSAMSTAMTAIPKFRDSLTYNFSKLRFGNGEISENKMLKMTVIMIGGFTLSCLPIVCFYFWRIFDRIKNGGMNNNSHQQSNCDSSSKFFFGAFHFSYINAFLNIMIYSVMSKSFRKALKSKLGVDKNRRSIEF